ncbi:MAG TPA: 4a-hydroxytetrahydrobiopterin dehydratase [Rhodocyclaceae bacterium]|nr:4a-hydroxytetrahydrobiopterin dehydratase [Rhodocyclaceae bacterium]
MTTAPLTQRRCIPCEGGIPPLSAEAAQALLKEINGWQIENGQLIKTFKFKNYYETISFVNASAWISNNEDHHPDLAVGYNACTVSYITHAIKGLSDNDFICAAKIDALFRL